MKFRKFIKLVLGFLLILVVAIALISIKHPIFLKWLSGSARYIGGPVTATVYVNGQAKQDIKIFHVDTYWDGSEADYFLVHLFRSAVNGQTEIVSVNKKDSFIGIPGNTSKKEYDRILGVLFQGEVGSKFTPVTDDVKGLDFDPQLSISDERIMFKLPRSANKFKIDTIVIEF